MPKTLEKITLEAEAAAQSALIDKDPKLIQVLHALIQIHRSAAVLEKLQPMLEID